MHIQTEQQPYLIHKETTFDAKVRDILLKLDVQQRYWSDVHTKNGKSNPAEIIWLQSLYNKKCTANIFFHAKPKAGPPYKTISLS